MKPDEYEKAITDAAKAETIEEAFRTLVLVAFKDQKPEPGSDAYILYRKLFFCGVAFIMDRLGKWGNPDYQDGAKKIESIIDELNIFRDSLSTNPDPIEEAWKYACPDKA